MTRDWHQPIDGARHELWILACLQTSLDKRITQVTASIPPAERNWDHIIDALGFDLDELDQRRAAIEDDIEFLTVRGQPND